MLSMTRNLEQLLQVKSINKDIMQTLVSRR